MAVSIIPKDNTLKLQYVSIPVTATVQGGTNSVILNWGDVGGSYLPGKTIVGAFLAFSSGSVLSQANCQVTDGRKVYLNVFNPSGNAISVSNIILAVFYHD